MAYGEYYTDPLFTSTHTHSQHLLLHPSLPVSLSLSLDFSQSTTVTWKNWRVMLDCLSFSDYNPVFPGWSYLFCLWTSLSHVFSDIREAIRFRMYVRSCVRKMVLRWQVCVTASIPAAVFLSSIFSLHTEAFDTEPNPVPLKHNHPGAVHQ